MSTNDQHTMKTALLIMDMQTGVIKNYPAYQQITENASRAIKSARERDIPVIYVVIGFRQGMPEISANNKIFAGTKERTGGHFSENMMGIDPSITPMSGEAIVTKRRVSAFTGSDLEVLLRSLDIKHLVLSGIATSGVVLSTLREAADRDYRLTVLSDACTDIDPAVHTMLLEKVFPMQSTVTDVDNWITSS